VSGIVRLDRQMAKPELIGHLERAHSRAVTTRLDTRRWTKDALIEAHRIIHIGLGAAADHKHRTPPWLTE
jgi:hypothetical protein